MDINDKRIEKLVEGLNQRINKLETNIEKIQSDNFDDKDI